MLPLLPVVIIIVINFWSMRRPQGARCVSSLNAHRAQLYLQEGLMTAMEV